MTEKRKTPHRRNSDKTIDLFADEAINLVSEILKIVWRGRGNYQLSIGSHVTAVCCDSDYCWGGG